MGAVEDQAIRFLNELIAWVGRVNQHREDTKKNLKDLDQRVKALEARVVTLEVMSRPMYNQPQPEPTDEAEIPQTASTIGLSRDFPKSTDDELGKIKQIIRDYHYALDTRQHGEVAMGRAMDAIMGLLCMPWESGAELNRRVVRGQE